MENDSEEATTNPSQENSESTELQKNKLLSDIKKLKSLISAIEGQLSVTTFKDIRIPDKFHSKPCYAATRILDLELSWKYELYALAGLSCKKIGDSFIFNFQYRIPQFAFGNSYWIELFFVDGAWQIGHWIMPMTVDVKDIAVKYSQHSTGDIKHFLIDCKHRIDCYNRRKEQYIELKIFFERSNLYNCQVQADTGFNRIIMKLFKEVSNSQNTVRIIVVHLCFNSSETRPSKILIESDDSRDLSEEETKELKIYFKAFKELDLKDAANKILMSTESQSMWKRRLPEDENIDVFEDDCENSLAKTLTKKSKRNVEKKTVEKMTDSSKVEIAQEKTPEMLKGKNANELNNSGTGRKRKMSDVERINKSMKKSGRRNENSQLEDNEKNSKRSKLTHYFSPANAEAIVPRISSSKNHGILSKRGKRFCRPEDRGYKNFSSTPIAEVGQKPLNFEDDDISAIFQPEAKKNENENDSKLSKMHEKKSSDIDDEKQDNNDIQLLKDLRAANYENLEHEKKVLPSKKTKSSTKGGRGGKSMQKKIVERKIK